jgi:AraC-like DNA-binding protein
MEDSQKRLVRGLLAYAVQKDVVPDALCNLAGIDAIALTNGSETSLKQKQVDDLWWHASQLSRDPLFGLHFGESLQLSALGVVGEIIKSCRTVGEALSQAAALTHLLTDVCRMELAQSSQTYTIRLIPAPAYQQEQSFAFHQTMDLLMVFVIHELDGLLLAKIKPKTVTFAYPIPNVLEYERVLRCKPVQQADEYAMVFDAKYWEEPILTVNYELQTVLLQKVASRLNGQTQGKSWQQRIYDYLISNAYLGIVSLEGMAANFNISPRSLQRKLKEEGITYQEIADQVRKSLSMHYLESGNYPVKEISYMLGYNELSAFARAFKRWTGITPVTYQKAMGLGL